jgi:hypothetical protein
MAIIKIRNAAIDLDAAEIPNLPASKITSGTLDNARISLDAAEIPNLDTAKITTGTFATAKLADDAVTAAKINNDIISGSTELSSEPADTDEFLVSDAGTLKRIDYSLIKGGGSWVLVDTQTVSGTPTTIEPGAVFSATYDTYVVVVRRYNNASGGGFQLQLGTSGGYTTSGNKWSGSGVKQGSSLVTGSSSSSMIDLLGGTSSSYHCNSAQDCLSAVIWIHNPFNSGSTEIHAELAWENATGGESHLNNVSGHPNTNTQYDRWKLICPSSSQTFEATTIIQTFGVVNA